MNEFAAIVDEAIRAVCPEVDGVSIGDVNNRATWRVDFRPAATAQQRAAAQTVVNTVDPSSVVKGPDRRLAEMLAAHGVTMGDLKSAINRQNLAALK